MANAARRSPRLRSRAASSSPSPSWGSISLTFSLSPAQAALVHARQRDVRETCASCPMLAQAIDAMEDDRVGGKLFGAERKGSDAVQKLSTCDLARASAPVRRRLGRGDRRRGSRRARPARTSNRPGGLRAEPRVPPSPPRTDDHGPGGCCPRRAGRRSPSRTPSSSSPPRSSRSSAIRRPSPRCLERSSTDVAHLARVAAARPRGERAMDRGWPGLPVRRGLRLRAHHAGAAHRRLAHRRGLRGRSCRRDPGDGDSGRALAGGWQLPATSLHRLDYGISFGLMASIGALAGLFRAPLRAVTLAWSSWCSSRTCWPSRIR